MRYFTYTFLFLTLFSFAVNAQDKEGATQKPTTNPPIYIAFLWHMHQPIYWPYESLIVTDQNSRYSFSVVDIHNQRLGPYNAWPKNAVQKGIDANMPHFGAQVSFSGSLVENLNNLEAAGNNNFQGWKNHWNSAKTKVTSLGNPRLDMVAFGNFHPLMGLIDEVDIKKQVEKHKSVFSQYFSGSYSKGMFPPENAFTERMIPPLKDEGIDWILVDNAHFDRACLGYPFSTGGNIYEMNKADQVNPNPNDWVQLNGLWAPTKNSAKWGRQPHYAQYVNPATGEVKKMIVVPADRYMGNEDGRGGFGALNYDAVMSQLESFNTDSQHPILIVLHHDGDNYGGGTDSYYGSNFQNFVNWLSQNPSRFVCTTIQDYLQMFPPDLNDVIHVESGSWSGADNGDPEFKKWLGDPSSSTGYSPDMNSWGVITAAKNYVQTAEDIDPTNVATITGWKYLMVGESSDYWYWDGSSNGIWDSHPTRAANQAISSTQALLQGHQDLTPPTIFQPQREPYNPGGTEWNITQPKDFKVWSYVYDVSGVKSVKLKYRLDLDGVNPLTSNQNETYSGGSEVSDWTEIVMAGINKISMTDPAPLKKALEYSATIAGLSDKLVDYYIEAIDSANNIAKSAIFHVYVGTNAGGGGSGGSTTVSWLPANPTKNDTITIKITNANMGAALHWGTTGWGQPNQVYWPAGTALYNGTGPAVETPMIGPDTSHITTLKVGPFNNPAQTVSGIVFVIRYSDNSWDNNSGQDYHIDFGGGGGSTGSFTMDGTLDASAVSVAQNGGKNLYMGWNGTDLYVATESAQSRGNDVFIFITDTVKPMQGAPWGKVGQVAGWKLYLANESTNNWAGWTNQTSSPVKAVGQILEGSLNVQNEFGRIPSKLYVAVGAYQTADGGSLASQIPIGNNDVNIDANEFYTFNYNLVSVKNDGDIPTAYSLEQNFPNPFNPITQIRFAIPSSGFVSLKIYDVLGKEISTLVEEERQAGTYSVSFKADKLASGMYFYRLDAGEYHVTKKMCMLK